MLAAVLILFICGLYLFSRSGAVVHLSVPLISPGGDLILHALDASVEAGKFFVDIPHGIFGRGGVGLVKILF